MIATFAFNAAILLALILIPLFYPQALSDKPMTWLMTAPPPPVEEPRPVERPEHAAVVQTQLPNGLIQAPSLIPHGYVAPNVPDAPLRPGLLDSTFGPGPGSPDGVLRAANAGPVVIQAPIGPQHISSGVAIGLLVHKVVPQYPAIGREIRLEGTVVLQATISKTGTIENLRVVRGPALLQQAALDAVAQWRYRPYLLNGQPVEVETTVNVDFRIQ